MKVLEKTKLTLDQFSWVDYDYYPESKGSKIEIYYNGGVRTTRSLIEIFDYLFHDHLQNIVVGQPAKEMEWGQFCLETWDFENDKPDYSYENKSLEASNYLDLLLESNIEFDYAGLCKCNDWNNFLSIALGCILSHKAPYSPLFYDFKNNYFFYFHHTLSVGLYYRNTNAPVEEIIKKIGKHGEISIA